MFILTYLESPCQISLQLFNEWKGKHSTRFSNGAMESVRLAEWAWVCVHHIERSCCTHRWGGVEIVCGCSSQQSWLALHVILNRAFHSHIGQMHNSYRWWLMVFLAILLSCLWPDYIILIGMILSHFATLNSFSKQWTDSQPIAVYFFENSPMHVHSYAEQMINIHLALTCGQPNPFANEWIWHAGCGCSDDGQLVPSIQFYVLSWSWLIEKFMDVILDTNPSP